MSEQSVTFSDDRDYERAIGRWSRAVAPGFIRWIEPRRGAHWLDVGCGSGILATAVLEFASPSEVVGIDPERGMVEAAARAMAGRDATFQVGDAQALPFEDRAFDVVVAALVLNFVPDRPRAVREMARVTRPGGVVAAYVWDFAAERSPSGPLRTALARAGVEVPAIPGTAASRSEALRALFEGAGLERIETRSFDVCLAYRDFDDFWDAQTPDYQPTTRLIASMGEAQRGRLLRELRAALPLGPGGVVEYFARANAVKGRVPKRLNRAG